jgi:actin-related protein
MACSSSQPAQAVETSCVVLDLGTGLVKTGMAGDVRPRATFPCLVGQTAGVEIDSFNNNDNHQKRCCTPKSSFLVGHEVVEAPPGESRVLSATCPVQNMVVDSWEALAAVCGHAWDTLSMQPTEHRIMLVEPALSTLESKQRILEVVGCKRVVVIWLCLGKC